MAEKKIYDAATFGDVATLKQVLQQDPHLVHEVSFAHSRNLLHIAAIHGQTAIVEEVLRISPRLARISDSHKSSPLHIAVEEGDLEITKILLWVAPEMCWWRDDQGMNPIHIAAVKGHFMILEELLQPDLLPARETVLGGQTVLHLCVKHRQIQTLTVLMEKFGDLVCAKDGDGETLLHLAVRSNQFEIVQYLVESEKIKKLERNSMGKTALDILDESFLDTSTYLIMEKSLGRLSPESTSESLPRMTDITMVVVVLIATMAFQAAVNPPGGVWQEDGPSHSVGRAVMATTHPKIYRHFIGATTTAFISSIITILLISTGIPQKDSYVLGFATYSMWVAITSIGVSYGISLIMTNPMDTKSVGLIVAIVVSVFFGVYALLFLHLSIRELVPWLLRREDREIDRRIHRLQQDLTTGPDYVRKQAQLLSYVRRHIYIRNKLQLLRTAYRR